MTASATSLFESYNARFLDPQTVAETFILREEEFRQLCEQNNSLLIGPRGSGKTTLLKMLKVGAQIAWKNRSQANILRRFNFAPIYVSADRQLDVIMGASRLSVEGQTTLQIISQSLLALRVKAACLDTVREITSPTLRDSQAMAHQFVSLGSVEADLCAALSVTWDLGERCYSLLEVGTRIQWQLAEINKVLTQMKFGGSVKPDDLLSQRQFFAHEAVASCESFVSSFNAVTENPTKVWALCIDELEIMPEALQQHLYASLRSIAHTVILKLATSPFSNINWEDRRAARPMPGHDFTTINLSFTSKAKSTRDTARKFSAKLLDAMIMAEGRYRPQDRPRGPDVLGRSPITDANTSARQREAYKPPSGEHYVRFKRLQENDPAFRQFLSDRRISLESVHSETEERRAGQVRKYIWQVAIRQEFGPTNKFVVGDDKVGQRTPSHKAVPDAYLGYDSLMAMCEGNPRTTIGLMRPLVRRYVGRSRPVPFEEQAVYVEDAVRKYVSLLSTVRLSDPTGNTQSMSIVNLLDAIGAYFSKEINGAVFKAEPSLTFKVDKVIPQEYIDGIGAAMNQGACVMIADESGLFDFGSLQQARLRLSYLLCPFYHLPLNLGSAVNLSSILKVRKVRSAPRRLDQDDLFFEGS